MNRIILNDTGLDTGIEELSRLFSDFAVSVFGKGPDIAANHNKRNRKLNSPWFNFECETARRELHFASRAYKKCKSQLNRDLMIACQSRYRSAKKRAKIYYKNEQKVTLHSLSRDSPTKFWNEVRKFKTIDAKCKTDNESLFKHFKTLFSNDDVFSNHHTESFLNNDNSDSVSIDELDKDFNTDEVISAINCLNRGKSPGIDDLLPEMFIACKELLRPLLCRLFNHMYSKCIYPISWTKGVIVPVPKKGDLSDVNNFRGITLTSIFSKVFSILLDNRLRKWAENNDVIHDCQFGFRKHCSTVDCIFILTCIIEKVIKREKRKLTAHLLISKRHLT